ncbi:glycine betaine ABC transporter substrate-binding protein [Pseudonocardia sp. CA-107938]|uniref:glycine betaine ABC transporter substrate-binding protein n=1 Tax=Pseudonocardia sp. CA-107938 TaxID=3240021 RepID=UPI003D90250E
MKTRTIIAAGVAAISAFALTACGGGGSAPAAGGGGGPACEQLVFGGPPEFEGRADGLKGISETYGCDFKEFKALDTGGPLTVKALEDGTVQAADLFTTDPTIKEKGFVVLEDPKNNFAAQNVVPLINKAKATPDVSAALNAVSAKLTTDGLIGLNAKLGGADKPDVGPVAKDWLTSNGLAGGAPAAGGGGSIIIGSADFPESRVLAEIYAQTLEAKGFTVNRKFGIGSREVYFPSLKDGSIDLIPEYTGTALQYIDKKAPQKSAEEVYTALKAAVPAGLTVLEKSAAEDKDAVVVTKATADKYGKSLADYGTKK